MVRNPAANLRTQFLRILEKVGITPWPKLFQNLRSTRQTELAERFPLQTVCSWMGNSERIAQAHYLQVLDKHFDDACGLKGGQRRDGDADQGNGRQDVLKQRGAKGGAAVAGFAAQCAAPLFLEKLQLMKTRGLTFAGAILPEGTKSS